MVSVVFFGSNFVPVKRFETSDGLYFQLILCCGIWITGFVFELIYAAAEQKLNVIDNFEPYAMLGGAMWATGNILCVPCIKLIGLSIGLLMWGTSSMLWGWAQGRFGILIAKELPTTVWLNYVGVGVAVVALGLYTAIKPSDGSENSSPDEEKKRMV